MEVGVCNGKVLVNSFVDKGSRYNVTSVVDVTIDPVINVEFFWINSDNSGTIGVMTGNSKVGVRQDVFKATDKIVIRKTGVLKANDVMRQDKVTNQRDNFRKSFGNTPRRGSAEGIDIMGNDGGEGELG